MRSLEHYGYMKHYENLRIRLLENNLDGNSLLQRKEGKHKHINFLPYVRIWNKQEVLNIGEKSSQFE